MFKTDQRRFIFNVLKLETTQSSLNRRLDKHIAYIYKIQPLLRTNNSNNKSTGDICNIMIGIYKKLCSRKEVRDKKLHTTWFYFYSILEPTKLIIVYGNKNEASV